MCPECLERSRGKSDVDGFFNCKTVSPRIFITDMLWKTMFRESRSLVALISFVCANEGKAAIRKRNTDIAFMRLAYGSDRHCYYNFSTLPFPVLAFRLIMQCGRGNEETHLQKTFSGSIQDNSEMQKAIFKYLIRYLKC